MRSVSFGRYALVVSVLAALVSVGCTTNDGASALDTDGDIDDGGDGDGDGDGSGDGDGDGSGDGDGDGSGDGDGDGGIDDPRPTVAGCDDAVLLERPALAERGPWAIGTRTLTVAGRHTEIWYPAAYQSETGASPKRYDPREKLPPSQRELITDADNPFQDCEGCYDGLPIDAQHGPYPVVVYVHGTAAWATVSLTQVEHWASRGFVVVAMDHPGLFLGDTLAIACPDDASGAQNLSADVDAALVALQVGTDGMDFVAPHVDLAHVGAVGHSAGGSAVASFAGKPGVQVLIPMAASGATQTSGDAVTALHMAGNADTVVQYGSSVGAYDQSDAPRRLVGLENAGHLVFSDICELTNGAGDDLVTIASAAGVCGTQFAGFLFDCDPNYVDPDAANEIINVSTAAVLEEVLMCDQGATDAFDSLEATYPDVAELRQDL